MNDYRAAAPAIQTLKAAYEKELWDSGAVDLVMGTVVASTATSRSRTSRR